MIPCRMLLAVVVQYKIHPTGRIPYCRCDTAVILSGALAKAMILHIMYATALVPCGMIATGVILFGMYVTSLILCRMYTRDVIPYKK